MELSLEQLKKLRVHLLGIGGIGVSALARMLAHVGVPVSGCDVRGSSIIDALESEGIPVDIGHSPEHLDRSDVVVYSTAIPDGNPEFCEARKRGMTILHRSELLAFMLEPYFSIGVTGTNGKGTVCTMLTWILEQAGFDPSFYIGGLSPNLGTNARLTSGKHLVAELDESDGSLLNVRPSLGFLNNLELDHLNYYKDFEQAVSTLERFFANLPEGAPAFFNGDDEGARQVADRLTGLTKRFFGRSESNDYFYRPISMSDCSSVFELYRNEGDPAIAHLLGRFQLTVPGAYNVENAAGAAAVALELGVPASAIAQAYASFKGLTNRYTMLCAGSMRLVKDYMSHPSGIRKVLETARLGEPRRLLSVFKPYRYTMIRYHATNYAQAFSGADHVIVTDMWEGGEEPIPGVDTGWLVNQMREGGVDVKHIPEMTDVPSYLMSQLEDGDCVVFFGGNDLFDLADHLAEDLSHGTHASDIV